MLFSIERLAREHPIRHLTSADLAANRSMPCATNCWKSTTPAARHCRPPAGTRRPAARSRPLVEPRARACRGRCQFRGLRRQHRAQFRTGFGLPPAHQCGRRLGAVARRVARSDHPLIRPTARPGRRNFARTEALAASPPAAGALRPARRTARHPGADPRATAAQAARRSGRHRPLRRRKHPLSIASAMAAGRQFRGDLTRLPILNKPDVVAHLDEMLARDADPQSRRSATPAARPASRWPSVTTKPSTN